MNDNIVSLEHKYLAPPLVGVIDVVQDKVGGRVGLRRSVIERGDEKEVIEWKWPDEKTAAKELYHL